jgi:hypothetical protein
LHVREVRVRGEHRQFVVDAKLCEKCVDRPDLDTASSAKIPQLGCLDVVLSTRQQKRQRGESFDDCIPRGGSGKSLKQLLEDQPGRGHLLAAIERLAESLYLRVPDAVVAPQCKRPDTRVDE